MYSREPANLKQVKADYSINAEMLVGFFTNEEERANEMYTGKVIDVYGTIGDLVQNPELGYSIVFKSTIDQGPYINCLIDKRYMEDYNLYAIGDSVLVRGFCTGKLFDIEINRATVIKKY